MSPVVVITNRYVSTTDEVAKKLSFISTRALSFTLS